MNAQSTKKTNKLNSKLNYHTFIALSLATGLFLFNMVACNTQKEQTPLRLARQGRTNVFPENTSGGASPSGAYNGAVQGYVTGGGQISDTAFQDSIRNFVSTVVDPNSLGTVDPSTGVTISGFIDIDPTTGAVALPTSWLKLDVWDSKAIAGTDTDIPINFVGAKVGQRLNNGDILITFEDQYGTVSLRGQMYGNYQFNGAVIFRNFMRYDGQSAPTSQDYTLGFFSIQGCGFFRCNSLGYTGM